MGVTGYDPIQGALSPPLRLLAHISAMFFLWSILLLVVPLFILADDGTTSSNSCRYWNVPDLVWYTAAVTVAVYSAHFAFLFHVLSGVSLPCGPRPHKITRQPAWNNRLIPLPALVQADKFRCAYADDSHEVTQAVFQGTGASLTGEPAGRDIWTGRDKSKSSNSASLNKRIKVDERLVQEMASGGRASGFNPAINPNRYVRYLRIIVLSCLVPSIML